jgi:hypothetical protein
VPAKIAQSIAVLFALLIDPAKLASAKNVTLAILTVVGVALPFVALKLPTGSALLGIIPIILGVITNLRTAFNIQPTLTVSEDDKKTPVVSVDRTKSGGFTNMTLMVLSLVAAFVVGILAFAFIFEGKARAQESLPQIGFCTSPKLCFQPAVALSAFQLNLKTTDYERVALMTGWGGVYQGDSVNLGLAIYGGVGISKSAPNAPQASLLFSIADVVAIGPGLQTFKDPDGKRIYQGLLTLALNYNVGGSPTYVKRLLTEQAKAMRAKGAE